MDIRVHATLTFGLANIPVGVAPLISKSRSNGKIGFKTLHKECEQPITQPKRCEACNAGPLTPAETVKGYEYAKGQYLVISESELAELEMERSPMIVMRKFFPIVTNISDFFDACYWLIPESGFESSYGTFLQALGNAYVAGVGTTSLWGKEHAFVVVPNESGLRLYTLHSPESVVEPSFSWGPGEKQEVLMAEQVIGMFTGTLEPEDLRSSQHDALSALIKAKLAGETTVAPKEIQAPAAVPDLMESLKATIAQAEKPKRGKVVKS